MSTVADLTTQALRTVVHVCGLLIVLSSLSLVGASADQGSASSLPQFAVASVKPIRKGTAFTPPAGPFSPGRYFERDVELRYLIAKAYSKSNDFAMFSMFSIIGRQKLLSERFRIDAKMASADVPFATLQQMIQALLAERFKLRTHVETRPLRVYLVTVDHPGRLGPNLRPSAVNCQKFIQAGGTATDANKPRDANGRDLCFETYDFKRMMTENVFPMRGADDIAWIIHLIQGRVDRPLVDRTGLTGSFEWEFISARDPNAESSEPSAFSALRSQLGLKLKPATMPGEVLVIDSVEMPTPD